MVFALTFIFLGLVTFVAVAFFLRPTQDQKALFRRVAGIKTERNAFGLAVEELEQYLKVKREGPFGWLEDIVEHVDIARRLQLQILQANSTTTLGTMLMQTFGLAVGVFLVAYLFSSMLVLSALIGLAASYIPFGLLQFKRGRRLKAFETALPDAIDMMARSLRAGHSLPAAISIVAEQSQEPAKAEFSEVFKQQNYGLPLRDALMQLLQRVPSQDLRVVVTGMLVQKDTGGNLAEILDRIVHVIRERVRIGREVRTHTAQGRMTGWILCLLPIVLLLIINVMSPGYSKVLFEEGIGRTMLYMGIGLLITGGLIIRQIVRGIEV